METNQCPLLIVSKLKNMHIHKTQVKNSLDRETSVEMPTSLPPNKLISTNAARLPSLGRQQKLNDATETVSWKLLQFTGVRACSEKKKPPSLLNPRVKPRYFKVEGDRIDNSIQNRQFHTKI